MWRRKITPPAPPPDLKFVHFNKPLMTKENDVFPQDLLPKTVESWIFLIVACLSGFLMGQWIRKRRNNATKERDALTRMANTYQKKRVSKKERRKGHGLSK